MKRGGNLMKKLIKLSLLFLLITSFTLSGCTALPNQPYLKSDASEAIPMKMIRYETPELRVYTTGGIITSVVIGAVIIGVIGAGLGYVIYDAATSQSPNPDVPDFGKLVMDQFIERSKKEIPNWPNMAVQEKTVSEDLPIDKTSYTLILKVGNVKINEASGMNIDTTITMKDKEGRIIWEKGYWYDPAFFNRLSTFDELKADKYKKLKEEFAFASEKTVTDFINHFKNSKPQAKLTNQ